MRASAVVLREPRRIEVRSLELTPPGPDDVVVDVAWSGVSAGTERLLWTGEMPPFPGMGYPLVPGYEAVGEIVDAGPTSGRRVGERVFAPGARCFGDVRGLFGASAKRLVAPGARVAPIDPSFGPEGALFALAATAQHALAQTPIEQSCLIVGHGALGRLLARLRIAQGAPAPTVWERDPTRRGGGDLGYPVIDQSDDETRGYATIFDVSGDVGLLDTLIGRLSPGGEIVLAGFYTKPVSFDFPQAFMREARLRVAAQWSPEDLSAVVRMAADGRLSLGGLITHERSADAAAEAYRTAFEDPSCLKMMIDWRNAA